MSRILSKASAVSVAATVLMILFGAAGSGAAAQKPIFAPAQSEPVNLLASANPAIGQGDANAAVQPMDQQAGPLPVQDAVDTSVNAASLAQLVAQQSAPQELSPELRCMAGAIYFEARNETLEGQLAVGRVIVARSKSGRFPSSYCGVVFQPSQFSFIRGNAMPMINEQSRNWKNAIAMAQIAHSGAWQSPVEGAMFFHAARVSPNWRLRRVAQIDNHVFYR